MSDPRIEWTVENGVMTIQLLDRDMLCSGHDGAKALLSAAIGKDTSANVIISLRNIELIFGVGISILLAIRSELISQSRKLCLIVPSKMVAEVFEVTRLNRLLLIAGDETAARTMLNGEG